MRGTPDSISISLQQTPIPTLWEKKELRSELRPALPLFSRPNDPFHQNTPHVNLGPLTLFADPGSYCLCLVPDDPESSLHLAVIWSFGGLLSLTPGPISDLTLLPVREVTDQEGNLHCTFLAILKSKWRSRTE